MPYTCTPLETKPTMSMAMDSTTNQPRKRQRLTHLSPDEKLMRRKLKNRVAAQTARDRKKAHMDSVEERLEKMEKIANKIQNQNRVLKQQNESLMAENVELKKRLGLETLEIPATQKTTKIGTVTTVKKEFESPESAALNAPQQQGQIWTLSTYLTVLMTLSLMCCWDSLTGSKSKLPQDAPLNLKKIMEPSIEEEMTKENKGSRPPWWGPQQKNWNPSKN